MENKTVGLYFSNVNHDSILEVVLKALKVMNCKVVLFMADGVSQKVYSANDILDQAIISNKKMTSSKVIRALNRTDFVIIDQLYSFKELLSFSIYRLERPNLMLIHNCKTWFFPQYPSRLVHKLKHFMTQHIRRNIGFFAVAGENMLAYSREELGINNIILVPFRYCDFDPELDVPKAMYQKGNPVRVVVPGMISSRRNYDGLLDAICQEDLKDKVELVLLGQPNGTYGNEILIKAKFLIQQGYKIFYWSKYIDNESFDLEIRNAHILFSYFESNYFTNNGQVEVYGVSKETGIALLMYNKAKVGILPASFKQMKSIQNQTITYSTLNELKDILLEVYDGSQDLNELQSNAIANALSMDINNIVRGLDLAYQSQVN